MKKILIALFTLILSASCVVFAACQSGTQSTNTNTPPVTDTEKPPVTDPDKPEPDKPDPPVTDTREEIKGVTFGNQTLDYDGQVHSITVTGELPQGVRVSYENNSATDAGEYNAKATLSGENYKTLVLNAKLTINKINIVGVTFSNQTLDYDGQAHSITVTCELPQGVSVSYENNSATDAGEYNTKATLTGKNYNTLALSAKLTINKINFSGISFGNETFNYDGQPHYIEIAGALPAGTSVVYSCAEKPELTNSATEAGKYTITATLTNKNYNTAELTAKLTINASEAERHIVFSDNTLYFANALDSDKLYSYSFVDESITRRSSDIPYNFTQMSDGIYFRSYSAFASSVKVIGTGGVDAVASVKGEYLCTDGSNLYYADNKIVGSGSGIYRLDLSGDDRKGVLISEGKAKYLTYANGRIYFADGANGYKLSSIPVSGGTRTLTVDEKITCLSAVNGYLFYTVDNLLGNYIANYNISTKISRKLTSDAGSNLTVIGNKLYYLNVDLLNSYLYGKGVYTVDAYPSSDRNSSGLKVIGEPDENYSSLTYSNNNYIAYYKVSNQMLCLYNVATEDYIEVLDGFVAPETTPWSLGSKTVAYENKLYYLDLYNDKALYSYDPATKVKVRITTNKVSDFAILDGVLYYNAVSWGVNNDMYSVNLKMGGTAELVSKYDCNDVVTDGENIYYVEKNAAGARTAIHKINAAGVDEIIYSKAASYLTYYEGYLYFVNGKDLLKMPVVGYTVDKPETVKNGNVDTFVIDGGVVYFRELYGLGLKRLSRINIDGTGYAAMMTADTDPLKIVIKGDRIYYYTDTILGTSGLYSISKNARNDETPTLILERASTYYASEFTIMGNKIYFVNYYNNFGDSHLYRIGITGDGLEKLD